MPENPTPAPANGPESAPAAPVAPVNGPEVPASESIPGAEALGDPGKRALDAMKAERNSERDRRKALEAELAALKDPKPETTPAQPSDADRKLNARIVRAEIKAAAAGKLVDPSDALVHLDHSAFEVNEDGEVDSAKLSAAIEDLLTRKPHLAASRRPKFEGSGDGGAQGRKAGPDQLTRADLKGKSPEWIAKAKAEGRLNDLLGHK